MIMNIIRAVKPTFYCILFIDCIVFVCSIHNFYVTFAGLFIVVHQYSFINLFRFAGDTIATTITKGKLFYTLLNTMCIN